jgi:hypothetical protein
MLQFWGARDEQEEPILPSVYKLVIVGDATDLPHLMPQTNNFRVSDHAMNAIFFSLFANLVSDSFSRALRHFFLLVATLSQATL